MIHARKPRNAAGAFAETSAGTEEHGGAATARIGTEKIGKLLRTFSIPAIIGMLANALYNIVDRIYVGRGVGALGIAGIAVTMPITMTFMASSMIVGIGANALFSIRLGEGRRHEVEKIMGHALVLLFLVPALVIIPCVLRLDAILVALGASPAIFPYAKTYFRIILFGAFFQAMGPGINHFIRSDGHPRTSMFTQLLGAGLNTVLDPIFIFVFKWGIAGAAWATVISQVASFAWVMLYFHSGWTSLRFRPREMKLEAGLTLHILAIGFAPFAMQMGMGLLNAVLNRTLLHYGGDTAVAAMGIIYSILILVMMPLQGLNQGAQPIIGYNYGAKKYSRVIRTYGLAVKSAVLFVGASFIVIQLFPASLIGIFGHGDSRLMDLGARALRISTLMFPVVGFQVMSANFFQAVGKPKQGTLLSLSRQLILLIPLVIILPRMFGLYGVFFAMPLADLGAFILSSIMILREMKRLRSLQGTEKISRQLKHDGRFRSTDGYEKTTYNLCRSDLPCRRPG